MPIRGKIINAFAHPYSKVFANEEVQAITRIILGKNGYKKHFDVSECQVERVIFMADADSDGNHIAALLLRLFIMYFPQMIKAGMVYKAVPPLYSIKEGKKNRYFIENTDMVKYVQKAFNKNYTVTDMKGIPVPDKDMVKFFIRNADYNYYLKDVSNTYAVDTDLLEIVLNSYIINKGIDMKKLKKEIESKYRFMSVDIPNKCVIGTTTGSNFIPLTDKFISDCSSILNIMESNTNLLYKINNKIVTIHDIMTLYDKSMPKNVQRYKGLGEMDTHELAESTLDINSRTLIQYTMESAKEDIEFIREYESDPKKILTHVGTVTREDLLD
jgi:DNA gyrase/topoisomerase IV subunit B